MGDDSEWMKLPTEQKVEHKTWKARVAGYEDLTKTFNTCTDEKSPEFTKYQGLIKKFATDSNAIAQEKALDCVLGFLQKASNAHIGRIASDVCVGLITKCLNATRAKTKEKGVEALMLIIEAEKADVVQEELLKALTNKQPKIVIGCIQTLREGLVAFGTKTLPAKPMMKMVPKLLEDRDKNVRDETKQLVIEVYRWVGQAIKPILSGLKPVQLTELEGEFDNLPGGTPKQTRFLRSQQDLREKMEAAAEAGDEIDAEEEEEEPAEDLDPFEMMTAVDILSKLPKNYYEQIEAKKWQDRREMLEAVQRLTENPKLEKGDYHDLVKTLRKVVAKDTNVMLVTLAAKCITGLANGLRKNFSSHAAGCVDTLLEKFREKKITVVTALREAVDAAYLQTTLDAISESCVEYLNHKTPTVKSETAAFMARCFCRATPTTLPKKLLKMFVAPLLKTVNEPVPDVREASFQALGTAMKVIGEKHLLPFLTDVDQIKMTKIKECCEKAELIGKSGKPIASKKSEPAGGEPAKAAAQSKKIVGGPPKSGATKGGPPRDGASRAGGASGSSRPNTALAKKKGAPAKKGKKSGGGVEECTEQVLSDEAVEEKATALLPADVLTGLASSNWKERLAAMENFLTSLKGMSRDEIPCQVCVRTLCKKPGLKENNFQVMKLKVELVSYLASNSKFTLRSLEVCVTDLVDKVGDVKNGAAVCEALTCTAEACGLEAVSSKVVSYAFEQKNPKNQSESLTWLANAIKEFGLKVNVKPMINTIKKAFGATNPAVRTSAITLVGVFHLYMGPTARVFFEDEKPALLQQIDSEIEKYAGQKPPPPTRGGKSSGNDADEDEEEEEEGEGAEEGGGVNVADLVPRNDISERITSGLVDELNDKNWKVRNEALQKVSAILNEAKFITPALGDLPPVLAIRLTKDANKVLVQATLTICTTLATAMGPSIKKHVSTMGPGILQNFGDSKPQVRQAAVSTLNAWVEQGGFAPFLEGELLADALKAENPNLRAELYGWAAEKLPGVKKLPTELAQAIPLLYAAQEDRKPEVRQKAQEATLAFMIHLGYDRMFKMAGKLKSGSKELVLQQLEKARPNLPAKPVKSKPAKAAAAAPTPAADPSPEDDSNEEEPSRAETTTTNSKPANQKAGAKKVVGGKKGAAPAVSSKKKKGEEEEDSGPLLKVNKEKEKRFKDEKTLKTLKWNFGAPQPEFLQQLRTQIEPNVSKPLMEQLFHSDFKQTLKALDALHREASGDSMESTIANLDVILKWLTLRFFDTNTTVLLKILEYLPTVFTNLSAQDYHLHEQEAYAFIPYLVNKVGDPKDNVRSQIRTIFKQICKVYPASKMFNYIIEGLKSKNTKTRTECLEELGSLIEIYGITVCQPSPAQALKLVAGQIGQRDNSVRSAALNTCVVAYGILGETIYKYVGRLNDKDMGMLEERIKRTGKQTKPASAPPSTKTSPDEKPKVARVMPSQHRAPSADGRRIPKPNMRRDFALEIEDSDAMMGSSIPQLIQHEDLDELEGPIKLPETRVRPPSPSMKLLGGSNEAKTAINLVISEIASTDVKTSVRALAQVDEVLRDAERCEALVEHADQLVVMFSMKLRMTYSKHLSPEDGPGVEESMKGYRSLLATLVSLFGCGSISQEISTDILKDLVYQLSMIMLDPRLEDIEEGTQVVRSVNILLVKVVEKSSLTNVMCALLRLLHDSVAAETSAPKFQEVVMKCLWKICRSLPQKIIDLDVDRVFGDIQLFLKAFPSHSWADKPSDVPLRTVKTIVHSITKIRGVKVLSHLTLVDRSNCELENYIKKILKTSGATVTNMNNTNDQLNGNNNDENSVEMRAARRDPASASKRLSKSSHDMLAEIFRKIGSKENTREGLNDLYDFKLKYPDANLEPFLKKSSQYFQSYIERGLKNIGTERETKMKTSSEHTMSNSSSSNSVSSQLSLSGVATDDVKPSDYIERLKILREKCGLDNNNVAGTERPVAAGQNTTSGAGGTSGAATTHTGGVGSAERQAFSLLGLTKAGDNNGSNSSLSSGSSSGMPQLGSALSKSTSKEDTSENTAANPGGVTNLVDLKRRLAKIKSQQK